MDKEGGLTGINFLIFGESFANLIGDQPSASVLAQEDIKFAHEAGVYLQKSNEVRSGNPSVALLSLFVLAMNQQHTAV